MTEKLKRFHSNFFETALACLVFLSLIGLGFYFYNLSFPDTSEYNPFRDYNTNQGIIQIAIGSLISRIIFLLTFLLLIRDTYRTNKSIKTIYLISALIIGFLQWFELYYSSTFYYGEIRDKQGLMFPVFSSLMVTLVIWKLNYSTEKNKNLTVKLVLTGLINIGLYLLWLQVYEPWNLWQS